MTKADEEIKVVNPDEIITEKSEPKPKPEEAVLRVKKMRNRLGIQFETDLPRKTKKRVLITTVFPGEQADRYGLEVEDCITGIDGTLTPTREIFIELVKECVPTQVLTVHLIRKKTGETEDVKVRMGAKGFTEEACFEYIEIAKKAINYETLRAAKL